MNTLFETVETVKLYQLTSILFQKILRKLLYIKQCQKPHFIKNYLNEFLKLIEKQKKTKVGFYDSCN